MKSDQNAGFWVRSRDPGGSLAGKPGELLSVEHAFVEPASLQTSDTMYFSQQCNSRGPNGKMAPSVTRICGRTCSQTQDFVSMELHLAVSQNKCILR